MSAPIRHRVGAAGTVVRSVAIAIVAKSLVNSSSTTRRGVVTKVPVSTSPRLSSSEISQVFTILFSV